MPRYLAFEPENNLKRHLLLPMVHPRSQQPIGTNAAMGLFYNYKKNQPWAENISIVMQLGLTMAGCIVCCFLAGRWLDQWLGTRGVFTVGLTLFGVVGGAVVAYRQIMEVIPGKRRNESGNGNAQH